MTFLTLLLWPPGRAAEPDRVDAASLGRVGESVGGGTIDRIERHPEFERYWLRGADGRELAVEATMSDGVHEGLCSAGGVVLFPRPELSTGDPADVDATALCPRLQASPPRLGKVAVPARPDEAVVPEVVATTTERLWNRLAVMAVGAVGVLFAGWTALRARAAVERGALLPVALYAVAAGLRPVSLLNGGGAGYEKLVIGFGEVQRSPYGDGFAAVMAPAVAALGEVPAAIFATNTVLGLVAVLGVWALVRGELDGRAATLAASIYALLPVATWLARTEAMHVPVTAELLVALALAGRWRRHGELVAAIGSAALVAVALHTRPEAAPAVGVVAIWGWRRDLRMLVPAGILAVAALAWIVQADPQQGVLRPEVLQRPSVWINLLLPHFTTSQSPAAAQLFFHAGFSPLTLWPFALLGLKACPRDLRLRLLGWIVLLGGPVVVKAWPLVDLVRLQLPVQAAWVILAAIGLGSIPGWARVLVVATVPLWTFVLTRWPQAQEFAFLSEVVPKLQVGRVHYDPQPHRSEKLALVMQQLGPARWTDQAGDLRYVGLSCYAAPEHEPCVPSACPVATTTLVPPADVDVQLPEGGAVIGFYRDCPAP